MIEEFDKEIDFLLRKAAQGESVQTFDRQHLDADEISLFAENALTAKTRANAAVHLAECTKCRKILSNVIRFNAESESETIHAAAGAENNLVPVVAAPAIPWYRRVFAFPQITFAMGALVLVFSGVIAFLVLQDSGDTAQNATVARNEEFTEKSRGTGGASSDSEAQTVETYSANSSNATGLTSNSNTTLAANTASNSTSVSADSFSGNVASPALRQPPPEAAKNEPATEIARQENPLPAADAPRNVPAPVAPSQQQNQVGTTTGAPSSPALKESKQQAESQAEREASEKKLADRDRTKESRGADENVAASPKPMSKRSAAALGAADKNKTDGARTIGGKTFRSVGGIWFDSDYNQQQQIMIRRGSDDYRRLDSGLRSIAESLGGTVIIVWKSKAYRIN